MYFRQLSLGDWRKICSSHLLKHIQWKGETKTKVDGLFWLFLAGTILIFSLAGPLGLIF